MQIAQRPYPSAGGIHELEIYPVVVRCEGLPSGLYHYDSWDHSLVGIPASEADVARIAQDAQGAMGQTDCAPQIILAITARFTRMLWKYRSIGYANILRDTGALYQTLYLVATEMGLAACGIGCGDSSLFADITGLDPLVEGTVGECMIGRPERAEPETLST